MHSISFTFGNQYLNAFPLQCITAKFSWVSSELCNSKSSGNPTNKYYVDYSSGDTKCSKDCDGALGNGMCRPLTDFSVQLFNTAEECCGAKVSWRSANECIADTENIPAVGTDDWYIDWKLQKVCCFGPVLCWCAGLLHLAISLTYFRSSFQCVKNCSKNNGTSCGGIAQRWDVLYTTSALCCGTLRWVDSDECVLA